MPQFFSSVPRQESLGSKKDLMEELKGVTGCLQWEGEGWERRGRVGEEGRKPSTDETSE